MKINLFLITGVLLLLVFAVCVYFFVWPWAMIALGLFLSPNPPKPEITYGEFPFQLEYEINGQRKVIEDTLICEFDGFGVDEGRGKYRKWKQRLASGNESIILLKIDDTKEIYYNVGSAEYYMGDYGNGEFQHHFPNASMKTKEGRFTHYGRISADELFNKYNIKLISWNYTPPIKNNFIDK